ncbi:MAG TPA: hypothetical protein PLP64_08835 [Pseudothermotoga sp.]|nr:hypothetical protein [Pseudothermotoga sp.]HOK84313.1 hypothetical protein [Pseudothermotoga sp.]HPP70725.1 hypothetical protein [Pseudothermotoga sp.]
MRKVLFSAIVFVCIYIFAYVPATADYVIFLKDFEKINSLLPPNMKFSDETDAFVCLFGKMTLNLSSLMEFIETEELAEDRSLLDLSVVTSDPDWVKKNFSSFLKDYQVIEANGLHYFVSSAMLQDVNAMINGKIPKIDLNTDVSIYVKLRTVPMIGIILHLLGFNEGAPVEDEISVTFDSDIAKVLIKSNKTSRYDFEIERAQSQTLPKGLKLLKDAQFSLVIPTSVLNQIPPEIMEEVELDLEDFASIFVKSSAVCLSFAEDMSKVALFFDFQEESLEDLIKYFEEAGASVRRTQDFVYLSSDEFVALLPVKGGIGEVLSNNVDEKELISVEEGILGRINLRQDDIFVDLSLYREGCSVIMDLKLSQDTISYVLNEILSEFLPKPREISLLNDIIDSIDFQADFMYSDPPEDVSSLGVVPEEYIGRIIYERKEEDENWVVTVGVKTDLADTLTEQDVIMSLSVTVDSVRIDRENKIVYVIKSYEKYQMPSAEDLIINLVDAIRSYYEEYDLAPETLDELLFWYVDYPEQVLNAVEYEQKSSDDKIVVTLGIETDEEVGDYLIEDLRLNDLFYKDGKVTVVFELP